MYTAIDCDDLATYFWPDKTCKVTIKLTIKNQAGGQDFVRSFKKVFARYNPTNYDQIINDEACSGPDFHAYNPIERCEYEDESLGLMKNGKMKVELFWCADKLTDNPVKDTAEIVSSAVQ